MGPPEKGRDPTDPSTALSPRHRHGPWLGLSSSAGARGAQTPPARHQAPLESAAKVQRTRGAHKFSEAHFILEKSRAMCFDLSGGATGANTQKQCKERVWEGRIGSPSRLSRKKHRKTYVRNDENQAPPKHARLTRAPTENKKRKKEGRLKVIPRFYTPPGHLCPLRKRKTRPAGRFSWFGWSSFG